MKFEECYGRLWGKLKKYKGKWKTGIVGRKKGWKKGKKCRKHVKHIFYS